MLQLIRRPSAASIASSAPARAVAVAALLGACSTPLSESECSQLLDHYTAKLVLDEHPDASQMFIAEKQAAARRVAHDDPHYEFDSCQSRVSRSQFECALRAPNVDSIEQCLML